MTAPPDRFSRTMSRQQAETFTTTKKRKDIRFDELVFLLDAAKNEETIVQAIDITCVMMNKRLIDRRGALDQSPVPIIYYLEMPCLAYQFAEQVGQAIMTSLAQSMVWATIGPTG